MPRSSPAPTAASKTLEDLRGKTFAFGDSLSTTGHVFPRKMFKEHGIDPVRDFKQVLYSGGHDATVLAVLNGKVDAGATYANSPDSQDTAWMRYLKNPDDVKKIHAIAFSEPIPADNLVINGSLDETPGEKDRESLRRSLARSRGQENAARAVPDRRLRQRHG